ncbi:CD1108 family mobile element protein [Lachnospiraceae bacterium SGI.066]
MNAMQPPQSVEEIKAGLETTEKGGVRQSIRNCLTVFQRDPLLSGAIAYNILTDRKDIIKPIGFHRESTALNDTDMKYLLLYLEETYGLSSRNIRKNRSQIHKENRLEQRAWKSASRYQYQKYLEEHPEMQKKLIRKLIQKQRIKREYQMAYRAGKIAKETKDTSIRSVNFATKIARKAQEVFVRNITTLISMGVLLILLLSVMTGFASCSAMFSNGISTVIASSYIADPDEIEKAELYYTQLEASLQQKINQMEARYPGKDEYRYNIGEIGHDPHTLISYLTASYGDFKFDEIKGELETIFSLQYGITVEEKSETRQETSTIQVGQSLGNVVTSGYCNCPICCGVWSGGPTASGAMPQANHTLAVDAANPFLPMGTKVVMNGIEYTVEDTGNFAQYGVQFDVYYDNHAVAEAHGHQTWECFLAEGNQNSVEVTRTVTADVLNVSVQAKPLRSVILSRMEEDEQEIYEEVYSNRGNLQTYKTPVELNWYAYISTYYGYSVNNGTGQTQLHRGVTINVRQGTEVKSAMNGFVVDVGYSGTFGNYVVTQDKKGVQIKYAYLQSISVANGQEVTTDTVIGTTGSTGSATGSQLYLELVKDGEYYNPVFYISTGDSGLYGGGGSYDDETVRRLFAEADKYLGMPYVWGGSSPETSFDCSGFVSYVFTNSGVCNMGRLTAQGIYDICMPVSPEEARPGDIIFFTGTYDAGEPVTHVGIYAGDGQMIHCGNPIQYTSINSAYWQSHFYAFGRP